MDKKDLKAETYYWIKTNGFTKVEEIYFRNINGCWCVDINHGRVFLSDYKMELIFGKGFAIREVDFDNDIFNLKNENGELSISLLEEFNEKIKGFNYVDVVLDKTNETKNKPMILKYDVHLGIMIASSGQRFRKNLEDVIKEDCFLIFK